MRYLLFGLALLGVLILACCWSGRAISDRVRAVIRPLERAAAGASADAGLQRAWAARAEAVWREGLPLLSCLVSHAYTEEISELLEELPLLRGAAFRRSCLQLRQKLDRLREMDLPAFGNIF